MILEAVMHNDWLSEKAENPGYVIQALSQINEARRHLKFGVSALDVVRVLADALNSIQNEWSLSASVNTEEIYADIKAEAAEALYLRAKNISEPCRLAFSIFRGSHIESQLHRLHEYSMDIEVCRSVFVRTQGTRVGELG